MLESDAVRQKKTSNSILHYNSHIFGGLLSFCTNGNRNEHSTVIYTVVYLLIGLMTLYLRDDFA